MQVTVLNMFSYWLRYYDLWGFNTEIKASHRYRIFVRFVLASHLILATILTLIILRYLLRPGYDDILGTINDFIKYLGSFIVYWSTIIECNLGRKCIAKRKLWNVFRLIDQNYCSHRNFCGNYLFKFMTYFGLMCFVYLAYLCSVIEFGGMQYVPFWVSYVFLMLMHQHRIFFYFFCLELIKNELKIIEDEVNKMLDIHKTMKLTFREFEVNRLKWIREYYGLVYELSECVNLVFGWSNLPTILVSFSLILTDVNWYYWKWYNNSTLYLHCEC